MKLKLMILLLAVIAMNSIGQKADLTQLFLDEAPLDIKLSISIKDVKAITNDTIYTAYVMKYKTGDRWDSIKVDVRARGMFRRKECYFPPLRLKIKGKDAKGTIFEGNKSLKLVMPCKVSKDNNSLVMKEYICYQMYEPVTPYVFNTRLVNIDFNDVAGKKIRNFKIIGFFIEDDDLVAKRYDAEIVENIKLHPARLQDSSALRHDLFQYLVANTDWSTTFEHNAKTMQLKNKKYVPLAYDFDMAGFVDAPYAGVNEELGIASVRDRLFRGFCRNPDVVQAIRKEYLNNEQAIMGAVKRYETSLDPRVFSTIVKFTEEFFATMKSDNKFKQNIIDKCRTK